MRNLPPGDGFRTFVIVWASQSVSAIGTALTFFAVNIWLTQGLYPRPEQKPMLAFALAAVSLAFAVPTILAAPIAGAWADRHDRRRIMIAMNLASGALSVALVAMMSTRTLGLGSLLAFMVLYCLCGAFHAAAFEASYAMLVPAPMLARATGMMQTSIALSNVLSPPVAAALIGLPALARSGRVPDLLGGRLGRLDEGAVLVFAVDALTFLFAALALAGRVIPSPRRADLETGPGGARVSLWADVRSGWTHIAHRPPLLWLLGVFASVNFVLAPITVMQPLLVKFNLAADWRARGLTFESAFALLATVHGLGGVIGAVAVGAWGGFTSRRVRGVVPPLVVAGALIALYGLSDSLYRSAALLFLVGSMWPMVTSHSQAIWMARTPREMQGRVLSARRLIAQFTFPLGTVLTGWVGSRFDPGRSIAALGATLFVFAFAQLFNPYLRRVDEEDRPDPRAEPGTPLAP